eukprot:71202-Prymnesium_polylepis.1
MERGWRSDDQLTAVTPGLGLRSFRSCGRGAVCRCVACAVIYIIFIQFNGQATPQPQRQGPREVRDPAPPVQKLALGSVPLLYVSYELRPTTYGIGCIIGAGNTLRRHKVLCRPTVEGPPAASPPL